MKKDITTIKSNNTRNKNNIEQNKTDITSNTEKIQTNTDNITKNTSDIGSANEKINQNTSDISSANEKITKNITDIKTLKTSVENINITTTGWKDLSLNEGLSAYSDVPQYKIDTFNNIVEISLRGSVKGLTGNKKTVISTLPLDKELTNPHYFVQNTSKKSGQIGFVRWTVNRNGDITYEGSSYDDALLDGTEWNPINTTFKD